MHVVTTIRAATAHDLPEIRELLPGASPSIFAAVMAGSRHHHVLVVDTEGGGLAAVAVVTLRPPQAHLEALVMAPAYAGHELEARLLGVSEALAIAFGCTSLDVPSRTAA